jgi:hypothetical protein
MTMHFEMVHLHTRQYGWRRWCQPVDHAQKRARNDPGVILALELCRHKIMPRAKAPREKNKEWW